MRREAKNFYVASRFLAPPKRRALEALYGVFRTADDLADEPGFTERERREGLASVARDLQNVRNPSYDSAALWFAAVREAFARYPIPIDDALGVVAACTRELDGVHPASLQDLENHAAMLTGGLARCGIAILGSDDPHSLQLGQRLGTAMQLTNILRDQQRDRLQGRDYFEFAGHGAPKLLAVKREVAARAREHYLVGEQLVKRLPKDGSDVTVMLAIDLHRALLERLERADFAIPSARARLGRAEVLWRAVRTNFAAFMR
jgi:phytoene/squalene synthetase